MNYRLGAHPSIAGGYHNALHKTIAIGGNCLQIFSASPRAWNFARLALQQIEEFQLLRRKLGIDPVYFHATYLLNLADLGRIGELSTQVLIHELKLAHELGIRGTIVHLGSYRDGQIEHKFEVLISRIGKILKKTPSDTLFIIENAGNTKIGLRITEIAAILNSLKSNRVRVCLDICHLHGAGYDLSTKEKFDLFFKEFDKLVGFSKLELFQVNDSKDALGSFRDRHENIGEGQIPNATFRQLLNDPRTKKLPFIIETPGFDKKGPDKKNLDILKSFT